MTYTNCKTLAAIVNSRIKTAAIIFASLTIAACASPQKVDRIHSSIYHQQASIQQLQNDMQQVETQRQRLNEQLQQLQAASSDKEVQIQQTKEQLATLDAQQSELSIVIKQVNQSVASNSQSINTLQNREQQRQAIIKAQQQRWQQITAQTDSKLADIEQPPADSGPESDGGGS